MLQEESLAELDLPDPEASGLTDEEKPEEEISLPYTLPLKYPFQVGQKTVSELVFRRRPKSADAAGVNFGNLCPEHVCQIAGRVCGISPAALHKLLDISDLIEVQKVVARFL